MNDIMKIVKALDNSNFLLTEVTKTIRNETKEHKGGFLSMILSTLGASLLGKLLTKDLSGKLRAVNYESSRRNCKSRKRN